MEFPVSQMQFPPPPLLSKTCLSQVRVVTEDLVVQDKITSTGSHNAKVSDPTAHHGPSGFLLQSKQETYPCNSWRPLVPHCPHGSFGPHGLIFSF